MSNNPIRVGIVGGAGYTGGELLRLLLRHPNVELVFVHSESNAGNPVHAVHSDLLGETELRFASTLSHNVDVLFLCMGHGKSEAFLAENALPPHVCVIDLSNDFRWRGKQFVYGLPELQRDALRTVRTRQQHIANPGCFATCIQLGLLPLAHAGVLSNDIHTTAITGSTGAGQSLTPTSHFSWRSGNAQVYKPFTHQHLAEIRASIEHLQPQYDNVLHFIPWRGNFTRGIIASSYTQLQLALPDALALYREYYSSHPFVHISNSNPDVKQVVNTNKCVVYIEQHGDMLLVISAIDNLLKGAVGQAVQNMNLAFGIEETAGLQLKAIAF